jgi:hypothetical protein
VSAVEKQLRTVKDREESPLTLKTKYDVEIETGFMDMPP